MLATSSSFAFQFQVLDATTKTYSFKLIGFQNAVSNPSTNAANSIFVELLTGNQELMAKNSYNVMVTPAMTSVTNNIADVVVSQDNWLDGQLTIVTYAFKLTTPINSGNVNNFNLNLPQYRYYY